MTDICTVDDLKTWGEESEKNGDLLVAEGYYMAAETLQRLIQAILDWDDCDTASQNRRSQARMLEMAKSLRSKRSAHP